MQQRAFTAVLTPRTYHIRVLQGRLGHDYCLAPLLVHQLRAGILPPEGQTAARLATGAAVSVAACAGRRSRPGKTALVEEEQCRSREKEKRSRVRVGRQQLGGGGWGDVGRANRSRRDAGTAFRGAAARTETSIDNVNDEETMIKPIRYPHQCPRMFDIICVIAQPGSIVFLAILIHQFTLMRLSVPDASCSVVGESSPAANACFRG